MMSVLIVGHVTLDKIQLPSKEYTSLGGPPIYMGLLMMKMGVEPKVLTRFGADIGDERIRWILQNGLKFIDKPMVKSPTTKFRIRIEEDSRELEIIDICDEIYPSNLNNFNAVLIAPVTGELSVSTAIELTKKGRFVYLDPQGFLRQAKKGKVLLTKNDGLNELLPHVDAMKVDMEEGYIITQRSDPKLIAEELLRKGVKEVIITMGRHGAKLYTADASYYARQPHTNVMDAVGAGDLLGAAYTFARYNMPLYDALIFALSCSTVYIDRPALEKIPDASSAERQFAMLKNYQ
ncbi:MAG: PfkB family carbohydrate kinase [Conexivisphaerales archaeon]